MKYLFFLLVFTSNLVVKAQNITPRLERFLIGCIKEGAKKDVYSLTKKGFVHFYAIAFSFDETGGIDSLYYSEKTNALTKELFGLNSSLLPRIKKNNFKYKEFSKKIVLVLFYHYNEPDDFINYKSGFLNSLENIIPESVSGKELIILKPIINAHLPPIQ